jgi:hypothetical protein
MSSNTILFLHLHRTGGTTLNKIIEDIYQEYEVYHIKGKPYREFVQKLKNQPDKQKSKYRVIKGHHFFGLHESLPQNSAYVTMVREPFKRVLSLYYWAMERPNFPGHKRIVQENINFETYMQGKNAVLDNGMTRHIAGYDLDRIPYGQCGTDLLTIAKKNIKKYFLAVGLTEFFDESLLLFKRTLGWQKMPLYKKYHVTKNKPPKIEVSNSVYNRIKRCIELDLELYQYIKERFMNQISKMGQDFQAEIQMFKKMNKQ